jgi:hypothetical protein
MLSIPPKEGQIVSARCPALSRNQLGEKSSGKKPICNQSPEFGYPPALFSVERQHRVPGRKELQALESRRKGEKTNEHGVVPKIETTC